MNKERIANLSEQKCENYELIINNQDKMKIAIIGPGSMGLLYAAGLSQVAEVVLLGNNAKNIEAITHEGVTVKRGDEYKTKKVRACMNGNYKETVDLVILFTKAYLTREALTANQDIIGKDTVLLTLQNGAGHESTLMEFVPEERVLVGTTAQGAYRENGHTVVNSGLGDTNVGAISSRFQDVERYVDVFEKGGFPCHAHEHINQMVWNKLMINASSSVLSGVLGVAQGYVATNEYAWGICKKLIREICKTACEAGYCFKEEEQVERIYKHLLNAPNGFTSIYADLKNGRKTEVDVISGAVVREAQRLGIETPTQQLMVEMVHAMEGRGV